MSHQPIHSRVYQEHLKYLRNCLQLDDLLMYMMTEGCISQRSYEMVKRRLQQEGPTSGSETLVTEVLMRDPDPEHFKHFLYLLEKTNQIAVARSLRERYEKHSGEPLVYKSGIRGKPKGTNDRGIIREVKAVQPMDTGQGQEIQEMQLALAASRNPQPVASQFQLPVSQNALEPDKIPIDRNNLLGRGNFGHVYRSELAGTPVAVKELPINKKLKNELSKMVMNEVIVSDLVRHPNIVQFMGYSYLTQFNDCCLLLVYEFVDGNNLENILQDEKLEKEFGFYDAKRYFVLYQIAKAIAYLHGHEKQIIHGDIKPANIMMTKTGIAKLCDLGLSKLKGDASLTVKSTAAAKGTPLYMAPEQLLEQKTSSMKSDVYSFGASLYEVLFGEYMWDIPDLDGRDILKISMREQRIPNRLQNHEDHPAYSVILKCVQFKYADRPDAMKIVEELYQICKAELDNFDSL